MLSLLFAIVAIAVGTSSSSSHHIPMHVQNAAYYGKYEGGTVAAPRWMARNVDIVEGEAATVVLFKRAGGRYGLFYTDPNKIIVAHHEPMYEIPEAGWFHDALGHRIGKVYDSRGVQYVTNPAAAATQAAFLRYTTEAKATGAFDFVEDDDVNPDLDGALYQTGGRAVEITRDEDLRAAAKQLMRMSALPVIFNRLNNADQRLGQTPLTIEMLDIAAGGLAESCFADPSQRQQAPLWTSTAQALLAATQRRKLAICMPIVRPDDRMAARDYAYASWLLTYDAQWSYFWDLAPTKSRVTVFPEEYFVPMQPLVTASSIEDLRNGDGAYVRSFARCFYRKRFVGRCAAVVNPSGSAVALPAGYRRYVRLDGDGVLDGGRLSVVPLDRTSLDAASGIILVR